MGFQIKQGDIFIPFKNEMTKRAIVLPHIVNDIGMWGKGFTAELDKHFPWVCLAYRRVWYYAEEGEFLGSNIDVPVSDFSSVVCMAAQRSYRSSINPTPLDYDALMECMADVRDVVESIDAKIYCPKFGAGLARGDWEKIEKLIYEIWVEQDIDVTVWDY